MKYIYLDTSQLLKWQNRTLDEASLERLDRISSSDGYNFVISDIHGVEISNKSERNQIIDDFKFIGGLRCIELLSAFDLFEYEVLHALDKFNGKEGILYPFRKIEGNYFSHDNINESLLSYEQQQHYHQSLNDTIISNPTMTTLATGVSKGIFKKTLREAFKERLKIAIIQSNTNITDMDELTAFILKDRCLAPSLKLNFYTLLYLFRNVKTKLITINDWFDILHFNAAPYVNYFSGDRESCTRIKSVIKAENIDIKAYISPDIRLLLTNILE
jgi:hypothetical protein